MAKRVLGKGINALFAADESPVREEADNVSRETSKIRTSLIEPNKNQPRKDFDAEALGELSDSIKKYGVLQPLILRKTGDTYTIIAGERRWRAAKLAGLTEVPAIIRETEDFEAAEIALIENLQREDLNPVEEAFAYSTLIEEYGLRQEELAERLSKNRTTITNSLRLLKAGDRILSLIKEGKLSAGHARALLSVSDMNRRCGLAEKVIAEGLSVRETEKLVKKEDRNTPARKAPEANEYIKAAGEQLTKSLGTKVSICPGKGDRGKIVIEYFSADSLNSLIDRLK